MPTLAKTVWFPKQMLALDTPSHVSDRYDESILLARLGMNQKTTTPRMIVMFPIRAGHGPCLVVVHDHVELAQLCEASVVRTGVATRHATISCTIADWLRLRAADIIEEGRTMWPAKFQCCWSKRTSQRYPPPTSCPNFLNAANQRQLLDVRPGGMFPKAECLDQ